MAAEDIPLQRYVLARVHAWRNQARAGDRLTVLRQVALRRHERAIGRRQSLLFLLATERIVLRPIYNGMRGRQRKPGLYL